MWVPICGISLSCCFQNLSLTLDNLITMHISVVLLRYNLFGSLCFMVGISIFLPRSGKFLVIIALTIPSVPFSFYSLSEFLHCGYCFFWLLLITFLGFLHVLVFFPFYFSDWVTSNVLFSGSLILNNAWSVFFWSSLLSYLIQSLYFFSSRICLSLTFLFCSFTF